MSDEMKPISEDGTNAAGDAPRRDSAQAAALTVGSSFSSSEQEIKHDAARGVADSGAAALSLSTKVGIAIIAVVSALFIGVSAFSITGGFGLPADSSIIQFAERIGIVSTSQVEVRAEAIGVENVHKSASDKADEKHEAEEEASADDADDSRSSDSSDSSGEDGSKSSDSADSSSGSSASSTGSSNASNGSSQGGNSGSSNASSGGSSSSSSNSGSAPSNAITVYVSVSSSAVGNPVSGGGTFTFAQGATVYDALCACGLSVNAGQTSYGIYVSAIGGLAEKEHGGNSGWMYSVNGAVPMTACSNYVLSNGDSVSWYYVTG